MRKPVSCLKCEAEFCPDDIATKAPRAEDLITCNLCGMLHFWTADDRVRRTTESEIYYLIMTSPTAADFIAATAQRHGWLPRRRLREPGRPTVPFDCLT